MLYWVCLILIYRIDTWSAQLIFSLAPLVAALDWVTQVNGSRESSNGRLFSGVLLGIAFSDVISLVIFREWFFLGGAAVVLVIYVSAIAGYLRLSGNWRKVLEEHFPRYEFPTVHSFCWMFRPRPNRSGAIVSMEI